MRVLHVAECLVGGVRTAIEGYVAATAELDHVVLANSRRDPSLRMGTVAGAQTHPLPTNHVAAIRAVAEQARRHGADVIHAHSSFAGSYARLHPKLPAPVVYTPHPLAFGRPDFKPTIRRAYYAAEWFLARRSTVLAGCSVHESSLLTRLRAEAAVVTIPNALPPTHMRWAIGPLAGRGRRDSASDGSRCCMAHNPLAQHVDAGDRPPLAGRPAPLAKEPLEFLQNLSCTDRAKP